MFAFCILLIILVGNAAVTAHAFPAGEAVREADWGIPTGFAG